MKEFISNPDVAYVITIISLIFGIIGAISAFFGIKSYFDQKKLNKSYQILFDNANREWVGNYTKAEIEKLNSQLDTLTQQIGKEIPSQVKKVLLESRKRNVEIELRRLCREHRYIKKELNKIHPVEELDKNIRDYIEQEIRPDKKDKKYLLMILILILAFAFFSSPVVYRYSYKLLQDVINTIDAKLYVEHITTYIMGMVLFSGIMLLSPFLEKDFLLYHKKIHFMVILLLFALWGILVYFISFNILIVNYNMQIIVGIFSLVLFAMAFKMVVVFVKRMR